jgi:ubiquitin
MKEKSLQHETMTLKQEKMLIQEIKELKSQRKKLIDNMGSAAEIDKAFDQKDSVFDKLKVLLIISLFLCYSF